MKTEKEWKEAAHFVIRNNQAGYYLGTCRDERDNNFSWNAPVWDINHYTLKGAERKLALFPEFFRDCYVIHTASIK